ncbi:hypothetical protein [Paenibacillus thermotolerans]|uniref:hypothetical protein n=1 Tax=Paenibacillus thermotolerans TaxID=3027807 RepID=UPI002367B6F9|nr:MULTISPECIES: hypothetical protein [unclassified Paenibacillus]
MLRNRTFLFGLGAGLIIAALILQIIYEAEKASSGQPPIAGQPYSGAALGLAELREQAGALGYELYAKDEERFTSEEVEAKVEEALAKQADQAKPDASQVYAFTIGKGTDAKTIAYMLVEMGLIDDWRAFMDEMTNRKLADSVQARYYIFKEKPDMQALITQLTTPGQ